MSFRWPNKDPDETLDYSVDWSRYLDTATISSVSWFVNNSSGVKTSLPQGSTVNTIINSAQTTSTDNKTATINVAGGTNNVEYTFTCQITDSTGTVSERTIKLRVREK